MIPDMTATGSGNSKKQAKHAAARSMLDKLVRISRYFMPEWPKYDTIPNRQTNTRKSAVLILNTGLVFKISHKAFFSVATSHGGSFSLLGKFDSTDML